MSRSTRAVTGPTPQLSDRMPRWAWAVVLVGGVVAYNAVWRVMVGTQNATYFPTLLLIGAVTVPFAVLTYAAGALRGLRLDPWLVILTVVVGGLIGTLAAGILEYDTMRRLGTIPMLSVGLIEESAKLIVPLAIFLTMRPHDPRGGIVLGIASGMGFATLETMGYGFQALLATGNLGAVDLTLQLRALLSPACHIAWTGMATAALWRTSSAPERRRAVGEFVLAFLLAVLLHALWDGSTSLPVHVGITLFGFAILLWLIHRARREQVTLA